MTRALVTGASGFTGLYLCAALARRRVTVTGCGTRPIFDGKQWAAYEQQDITEAEGLRRLVGRVRPQWIFNLAARRDGDSADVTRINVEGARNVADAARLVGAHLVHVGSASEYAPDEFAKGPVNERATCRPTDLYGKTKLAGTRAVLEIVAASDLHAVVARPFNIVGARVGAETVVGSFLSKLRKLGPDGQGRVTMGPLDAARDFLAATDAVDAYIALMQHGASGELYNVCTGQPIVVRQLISELIALAELQVRVDEQPVLGGSGPRVAYGDSTKLRKTTGWVPKTPLRVALQETWASYLNE